MKQVIRLKKVLFVANSDRHIKLCHLPYMKMFQDKGYIVHVATDSTEELPYCDKKINLKLKRNPYSISNLLALKNIRKLVKEEKYDIISCHTPVGGFLGRAAVIGRKNKLNTKVIYTAHGFHFYKNSSPISWIIYYPLEKYLSRYSDCVITMNEEDYRIAKEKFHTDVYKINGIGLNIDRLRLKEKNLKRKLNLNNKYIVTYIAEISKRKRQLEFLKRLKKHQIDKDIILLFIGDINIKNVEKVFSKYDNVRYLGFKENIGDYIKISDLIISPSYQEGLPQNILEAKYFKKTIIGMNIRGTKDLLEDGSGILVDSLDELIDKIEEVKNNNIKCESTNIDKYLLKNVKKEIKVIINKYIENKL